MSQSILCPHCQRQLAIRDQLAGKRLACPHCKGAFLAPEIEIPKAIAVDDEPEVSGLDFLSAPASSQSSPRPYIKPKKPQPVGLYIGGCLLALATVGGVIAYCVVEANAKAQRKVDEDTRKSKATAEKGEKRSQTPLPEVASKSVKKVQPSESKAMGPSAEEIRTRAAGEAAQERFEEKRWILDKMERDLASGSSQSVEQMRRETMENKQQNRVFQEEQASDKRDLELLSNPAFRRTSGILSIDKLNGLKLGMSLAQVTVLLGFNGQTVSENEVGTGTQFYVKTIMVVWKDGNKSIQCVFQHRKLTQKSQVGLE